ncbi:alpha/beta hydrolase [Sphingomonas sp. AR_OL41]|uniref:alpha/beta hydrolase n=1 Tax=Sphingomonas sp. AR_OL41 TaxID=3042729 RepID=UPI0024803310|nr:alpha/beta hydrolase [Sphingomonas sp. AR_OL41]MDH7972827.1 alpha/beta hydrolase [Sphingomonas sp. AR_OL41]
MFEQSRRSLILGSMGLASLCAARAGQAAPADTPAADTPDEMLPLWPGTPPGGANVTLTELARDNPDPNGKRNRRLSRIFTPLLVVKRAANPNGAAVMAIPGGGYSVLNYDGAGTDHARWLNALGVTTFILVYRLPGDGWAGRADVPLQDAQRAMRLIRANADRLRIDPTRIGILGSSAGGHVAGSLATRFDDRIYDPVDAEDNRSARPDLTALLFPVVTMGENAHVPSRTALLGANSTAAERDAYSLERHVTPATPPMFLCCAGDDRVVSPGNTLAMYRAALDAGVKAELHVFQTGGHGFGVQLPQAVPTAHWPEQFARFARYNGLFA